MVDSHPLASERPSLTDLVQAHSEYMSRLSDLDRATSKELTDSLNVPALLKIAGQALGSECHRVDKIYEGGFNQIFGLSFRDSDILAIARINMPLGGGVTMVPPEQELRDRVHSEAATLRWLQENTSVPVPRIFAYDDDPANAVGAAYIIEERILGQPLQDVWHRLCLESRMTVVQQLAHIQAQLYNTSFPKIGSLYEANLPDQESRFYVGRSAPPVQLERKRIDRGPWSTSREQLRTMLEEQLNEIQYDETTVWSARRRKGGNNDNSAFDIQDCKMLYAALLHLVTHARLFDAWEPSYSLSHPDLTLRNILVGYDDPTRILALVDWEGARIQPWWQTFPTPDLLWQEDTSPDKDTSQLDWEDVRGEFGNILHNEGPRDFKSKAALLLAKVECMVVADYACWVPSVVHAIDRVLEWRFLWPQLHDPAFAPLDSLLRRFHPSFSIT